jgi:hypothetical protein
MSVTNKTIRDLENAAMEAVQAMNELTELLEGVGSVFLRDQRIANRLERLRIASAELDRAETACSRERTLTMSEEDMREEFAALGLDWDETTERGQAHLQKLLAEYDADKIRVGASVDGGRPRSGFKIPDAPAVPQPRTVLDIPPDPSGEAVVRLDEDRLALCTDMAVAEAGRRLTVLDVPPDTSEPMPFVRSGADPQLLDLPIGHHQAGLGDGGKSETESYFDGIERFKRIAEARAVLKANDWVEDGSGEWSPAASETWAININREECSPAILRALAVLAEEAQS